MRVKNKYPDWVKAHRAKGRTIRKLKSGYGLYQCTSTYVKGKNPKSVQTYLGMITEKDGFIPKTVVNKEPQYMEFALSSFIMANFKRALKRRSMGGTDMLIHLGVIQYIFGSVNEFFLDSSYLTHHDVATYYDYYEKISHQRIKNVEKVISELIQNALPDELERHIVLQGLRLCVLEKGQPTRVAKLPPIVNEIIKSRDLKYEK